MKKNMLYLAMLTVALSSSMTMFCPTANYHSPEEQSSIRRELAGKKIVNSPVVQHATHPLISELSDKFNNLTIAKANYSAAKTAHSAASADQMGETATNLKKTTEDKASAHREFHTAHARLGKLANTVSQG